MDKQVVVYKSSDGNELSVKQLSEPPDPPRRRIGFNADDEPPTKPYGKVGSWRD